LASCAFATASPARRRALHRRLAELVGEPEERARQRALACVGPDAAIALALEDASQRARARGAPAAAANLAEQATRLTPPDAREDVLRRTMEAASNSFEAGDADRARALFERAVSLAPTGPLRAEALTRLARAHGFAADLRAAAGLYRQAIAEAESTSEARAEAEEGLAVTLMRLLDDLPSAARHATTAVELAELLGNAHALAEFRASHALIVGLLGDPRALELIEGVEHMEPAEAQRAFGPSKFLSTLWGTGFMSAILRMFADDLAGARRARAYSGARHREG
jgi:tetratricopeptide (TPR) repeat protein